MLWIIKFRHRKDAGLKKKKTAVWGSGNGYNNLVLNRWDRFLKTLEVV